MIDDVENFTDVHVSCQRATTWGSSPLRHTSRAPCVALRIAARPDFALRVYVCRFIDNVIPWRRGFCVRMRAE